MKIQIPAFSCARVLVVGDVMLDRYWHGATSRISPEAPVPVVRVESAEDRPGGAANVAVNIATLGAAATVLGMTGADADADALGDKLASYGARSDFVRVPGVPTITKLRVISRHQQLIRLDFEDGAPPVDHAALLARFKERLAAADVVVLSDYGKGVLKRAPEFITAARAAGKPVLVDPKGRDFSIYRGASVITPNRSEFEAVVGPCAGDEELVEKGLALLRELELTALLITRGEEGMTLLREGEPALHLPTHAREVFDVTGAGDTVISVLAAALAAGLALPEAMVLSNTAAGIVVGKLGTASVTVAELRRSLFEAQHQGRGVVSEEQLLQLVEDARAHGETIVMTNGCFDILHAGHVAYLQQAASLGQRLIVAVNDDASVRRLKGAERPINTLSQRMAVLAGLASVDWVLPFSEDTPERLICKLLPHVLVKGGDYRIEDIAGGRCVQENGGSVVVLDFVDGCSTTRVIETIRGKKD
jgi:D-beta-D-heptose 7-phosphate kinase/D-beta-D-heptose 1-phosphate adenosyltransferase